MSGEAGSGDLAGEGGRIFVDARNSAGVQVGDHNTTIINAYGGVTWSGGVAPAPLVGVSGVVDSPYRGLSAFGERDAGFFFGREQATEEILKRLGRLARDPGLLVVSGTSGAGKSSLLRAGVLPRLNSRGVAGVPGSAAWPCLVVTPARAPLSELAVGAAALTGADAGSVRRALRADPAGFALTAQQAARAQSGGPADDRDGRRLVVVVDQFEQVFTQCADEDERAAFITALHAAATLPQGPGKLPATLVVLVVRADLEARCADYPELAAAVQDRYLLTAMNGRQLRMAVTEPARKAGSVVDGALAGQLLREAFSWAPEPATGLRRREQVAAGVLPLLSHALDQAWRHRESGVLALADYERAGGIEGSVAASAERAYRGLTPGQQAAARTVFIQLTVTAADGAISAGAAGGPGRRKAPGRGG